MVTAFQNSMPMSSIALNSSFERGKSDVSDCPKVLNEQFGQRDIGVTVLSVTCATERALNGAAVVLFPLFTDL